jgi:hypothetical protein
MAPFQWKIHGGRYPRGTVEVLYNPVMWRPSRCLHHTKPHKQFSVSPHPQHPTNPLSPVWPCFLSQNRYPSELRTHHPSVPGWRTFEAVNHFNLASSRNSLLQYPGTMVPFSHRLKYQVAQGLLLYLTVVVLLNPHMHIFRLKCNVHFALSFFSLRLSSPGPSTSSIATILTPGTSVHSSVKIRPFQGCYSPTSHHGD